MRIADSSVVMASKRNNYRQGSANVAGGKSSFINTALGTADSYGYSSYGGYSAKKENEDAREIYLKLSNEAKGIKSTNDTYENYSLSGGTYSNAVMNYGNTGLFGNVSEFSYHYENSSSNKNVVGDKLSNDLPGNIGVSDRINFNNRNNIIKINQTRDALLQTILQRFTRAGMSSFAMGATNFGLSQGMSVNMLTYSEFEETDFAAKGQAVTEDGRVIDFNVDITMSRSFMQYTQVQLPRLIPSFSSALMDPLVINVGSDVAQVSDQKFKFDLDCDGEEEEISMLGRGSGFLALDINGDGKINDGSELFGTKSGDGFEDLRKFDSDGNGWIDENDDIYNKLRVWYVNENGNEELIDLKTADVGAIFLGEQGTEFTMLGGNQQLNAVVRSTGIFLKESGGVGTVQHVDLATGSENSNLNHDAGIANLYGTDSMNEINIMNMDTFMQNNTTNQSSHSEKSRRERSNSNAERKKRIEKGMEERRLERKRAEARKLERRIESRETEKLHETRRYEKHMRDRQLYQKSVDRALENDTNEEIDTDKYTNSENVNQENLNLDYMNPEISENLNLELNEKERINLLLQDRG